MTRLLLQLARNGYNASSKRPSLDRLSASWWAIPIELSNKNKDIFWLHPQCIVSEHWHVAVVNNGYRGNFSFRFSPFVVKPDHCLFYQQMVHFMEKCLQVTCVHFLRTFLFGHLASGNHVGRRGGVGVSEEGSKGSLSKFIEILSASVNGINTT